MKHTLVESINLDEVLCDKLIKFPSPKVSASRRGIKSMHMEQMVLLKKMDPKIFKDKPANKTDCYTHGWKHFKKTNDIPVESKMRIKIKT